jgi:hypothetical protein
MAGAYHGAAAWGGAAGAAAAAAGWFVGVDGLLYPAAPLAYAGVNSAPGFAAFVGWQGQPGYGAAAGGGAAAYSRASHPSVGGPRHWQPPRQ